MPRWYTSIFEAKKWWGGKLIEKSYKKHSHHWSLASCFTILGAEKQMPIDLPSTSNHYLRISCTSFFFRNVLDQSWCPFTLSLYRPQKTNITHQTIHEEQRENAHLHPSTKQQRRLACGIILDPRTVIIFQLSRFAARKTDPDLLRPCDPQNTKCHDFFFEGMKIAIRNFMKLKDCYHVSYEYAYDYAVAKNWVALSMRIIIQFLYKIHDWQNISEVYIHLN